MRPILRTPPKLFINTNNTNNKSDMFYEYNYDDNGLWGQYTDIENQYIQVKNDYPVINTYPKPDTNPDIKSDTKPDIKPDSPPDTKLDIKSDTRINTNIYYNLDDNNNTNIVNFIVGQIHIVGIICLLTVGNILLP
jgi:hypothetical protein